MGSETLSATNDLARRLDEWQFDLGEGPCWDAVNRSAPVLETDFTHNGAERWPSLFSATRSESIGSLFAFPMKVGSVSIGAVDLFSPRPSTLSPRHQHQASAMADAIGQRVVRDVLTSTAVEQSAEGPFSRRTVHQATGLVLAQVDVSADDALLLIQTHAHASGLTMMEVSERLLAGRLTYTRVDGRIEVRA